MYRNTKILYCDSRARLLGAKCWARGGAGPAAGRAGGSGVGRSGARQRAAGARARQARGARRRQQRAGAGLSERAGARQQGRGARGLALGCPLDALGLFSTRFDSVFFLSQIFGHCS